MKKNIKKILGISALSLLASCAPVKTNLINQDVKNVKKLNQVKDSKFDYNNLDEYAVLPSGGETVYVKYNFTPKDGVQEIVPITKNTNDLKDMQDGKAKNNFNGVKLWDFQVYGDNSTNVVELISPHNETVTTTQNDRFILIKEGEDVELSKIVDPSKPVEFGTTEIRGDKIISTEKKAFGLEDIVGAGKIVSGELEIYSQDNLNLYIQLKSSRSDDESIKESNSRKFISSYNDLLKIVDKSKLDEYLFLIAENAGSYLEKYSGKSAPKNLIDLRKEIEAKEEAKKNKDFIFEELKKKLEVNGKILDADQIQKLKGDAYRTAIFGELKKKYPQGGIVIDVYENRGMIEISNPAVLSDNLEQYNVQSKGKAGINVGTTLASNRLGTLVEQYENTKTVAWNKLKPLVNPAAVSLITGRQIEDKVENDTFNIGVGYDHLFGKTVPNSEIGIYSINFGGDLGKWNVRVDLGYGKNSNEENFLKEKKANPKDPKALTAIDTENRRNFVDIYRVGGSVGYKALNDLGLHIGGNIDIQKNEIYRDIQENMYSRKRVNVQSNNNQLVNKKTSVYGGPSAGIDYNIKNLRFSVEGGLRGDSLDKKAKWNPSVGGRITYRMGGQK